MLNELQTNTLLMLESGQNVFLSGPAGTGKSYVLQTFIKHSNKNIVIAAPTGVAAINIGGQTLHKLFRLPIGPIPPKGKLRRNKIIESADIVIIDEISMCRFDAFQYIGRVIKDAEKKTGRRKQLIVVGDFYQLPPVMSNQDKKVLEELWGKDCVGDGYAFRAPIWEEFEFVNIVLKDIVRQDNESEYAQNLNEIRIGNKTVIDWFNQNAIKEFLSTITLCGDNKTVNNINKRETEKLNGYGRVFKAIINGNVNEKEMIVEKELHLKEGMRVMAVINHPQGWYQNGTLGTVEEIGREVTVRFDNGRTVNIDFHTFEICEYSVVNKKVLSNVVGSYTQFPLKIAYAITIHKCQGQTYEAANIHPSCFSSGQLYVAMSRVKSIQGLCLSKDIQPKDVITSLEVKEFYNRFN